MSETDQNGFFGFGKFAEGMSGGNTLLKLWMDGQQSAFQSMLATAPASAAFGGEQGQTLQPLSDLWKSSMEKWLTLAQQQAGALPIEDTLSKLFDPTQWVKASQDPFHNAIEQLNAGPSFDALWTLDKKMLRAQQLRLEHERNIANYHAIVRANWKKAYDLFLDEIKNEKAAPLKSWRETTNLWVKIANQVLIDMHRTPEFLETQRNMTRSATDYRLQEREIVEAFCEAHHIPTRTEVDEVQHTVHDLRRQVRQLQRLLNELQAELQAKQTSRSTSGSTTGSAVKPAIKKAVSKAVVKKPASLPTTKAAAKPASKKASKKTPSTKKR